MEQVSSFLENILAVESGEEAKKRSLKMLDKSKTYNSLIIDKLIESLIGMIIPVYGKQDIIHDRMEMQKKRSPLSMNVMTNNAINLNARLTNVFIFFDSVIKFINWENPYLTIGVLLVITNIIMNPILATILPFVVIINGVLIPHYLIIHPPENTNFRNSLIPDGGPILQQYKIPGPVPQFSQEFLLNFTDLQNHMTYFISGYDFLIWLTTDYLYFKDEDLSSVVYLSLLVVMGGNLLILPRVIAFLSGHITALKLFVIMNVWIAGFMMYPDNREVIFNFIFSEDTRVSSISRINRIENLFIKRFLVSISKDPELKESLRLSEVFELQKFNRLSKTWDNIGFANGFYSINHPLRKLNSNLFKEDNLEDDIVEEEENIKIPRALKVEDVKPPKNFQFLGKWYVDLNPQEWVTQNLVNEIVNIDNDEKWVYDFYDDESEIFRRRRWIALVKRESTIE